MKHGSLERIVADMARQAKAAGIDEGPDSFADPVLTALHRQYLDALAFHKKLVEENGVRDPMTEVAADMLDSARSAVQTRLIELLALREEETQEDADRRQRARHAEEEAALARAKADRRRRDGAGDLIFWYALFYWFLGSTVFAARQTLSAANDFSRVCSVDGRRRTACGA